MEHPPDRYSSFDSGDGAAFASGFGNLNLEQLASIGANGGEPPSLIRSRKQDVINDGAKAIINQYT